MPLSKKLLEDSRTKQILCYCVFASYLFFMHCRFFPGDCDDSWFAAALENCTLWEYLVRRYGGWTSRLLPEIFIVYLTRCNPRVWKILDILFILLFVYGSVRVFGKKSHYFYTGAFMLLCLLVPPSILHSSGWITQSVNYTWTIAAGVYALMPLRRYAPYRNCAEARLLNEAQDKKRKIGSPEGASFLAAGFFACFQEQVAAVLFTAYLLFIGYQLYRREKVPRFWYFMLGLILLMLCFILTCPGNGLRSISETEKWFPQHEFLSIWEKLLIGFLQTFSFYVSAEGYQMIFMMFAGVLFFSVCALQREKWKRMAALFPAAVSLGWGLLGRIIADSGVTSRTYWMKLVQNNQLPQFGVYGWGHIFIECVVFLLILCAVLVSLYFIFGKNGWFAVALLVLGASLCSRIIIGFSPTVYASLSRTALVGCAGFLILTLLCIQETVEKRGNAEKGYVIAASVWYALALSVTICAGSLTETY